MTQSVFQRYEKKYLLNCQQYEAVINRISHKMNPDVHGTYTIMNLYYDTDNFDIIQRSIEKPVYKEKLRLRSYGQPGAKDPVFLELKKKYKGVVYKRRIVLPLEKSAKALEGTLELKGQEQIYREILYFAEMNSLKPKVQLCYNRQAFAGTEDTSLRITFDSDVKFRQGDLGLDKGSWGREVLNQKEVLMEIKTGSAMPLWLAQILSEFAVFPTSFSKYGVCYKAILNEEEKKAGVISA